MRVLGEITINKSADPQDWLEVYPQLKNGQINFSFNTADNSYTMRIFYNIQAENLFFTIESTAGIALQSQVRLIEYPINLLFHENFLGYALYYKDEKIYFGAVGEIL